MVMSTLQCSKLFNHLCFLLQLWQHLGLVNVQMLDQLSGLPSGPKMLSPCLLTSILPSMQVSE